MRGVTVMKNPLRKRLVRDLKSNRGRYIAISVMLTVTIALISGFLIVSDGIQEAIKENGIECKIEDGLFTSDKEISDNSVTKVEKLGASVSQNYYINEKISDKTTLRIYRDREKINLVTVIEGKSPVNKNEIAVERLYSESNDVNIGDKITVCGTEMTITGLISVPDYSALFQNNSDLMMDSFHFGIGIVSKATFQSFPENEVKYNYSYYFDERNLSEKEKRHLSDDIKKCLVENGTALTNFCTSENNQSISYIQDDFGSDVPMMKVFLFIIIGIMAFVFLIIISSTIESESTIIGTLLASGYGKYELLRHYLAMPIIVTLFSAAVGNVIGYTLMPGFLKGMYYGSYSLPPMEVKLNLEALLLTTVLPIVLMIGINFVELSSKLSISPLNFLRRELKKKKNKRAIKLPNLSFLSRFRMRVIIQNISSYITLFVGVLLASFILMFGLCITPMINHYVDSIKKSTVSDYQYILKAPVEAKNSENAEKLTFSSLETYYKPADKNIEVSFYGLCEDSKYFTKLPISADEEGSYLSDGLSKKINAKVGDIVTFVNPYTDVEYKVKVIGIYDYPAGLTVFMSQKQLNILLDNDKDYFNGYFSDKKLEFADENYLAAVITPDDMTKLGDQMLSSLGQMAPLCLTISIVIYLVLMYILTKIVIDKNAINISFMKVFGYKPKEIRKLYLRATTIVVLSSLLLGLPLIYLGIQVSFTFVLMKLSGYLPVYIPMYLYPAIVAIGMASYFIINFFHVKRVNRIEMSAALKNRE